MGTPYTFDRGMGCHSTKSELFYFDDNFRRKAQWVPPWTPFFDESADVEGLYLQSDVPCNEAVDSHQK